MGVADSLFGDSKLMRRVRNAHQGTLVVEGKASYCFTCDGRQIKGHDRIEGQGWHWHQHLGRWVSVTCGSGPRAPPMAE